MSYAQTHHLIPQRLCVLNLLVYNYRLNKYLMVIEVADICLIIYALQNYVLTWMLSNPLKSWLTEASSCNKSDTCWWFSLKYRVSHLAVDLGWVDLDLGCSTTLPVQ